MSKFRFTPGEVLMIIGAIVVIGVAGGIISQEKQTSDAQAMDTPFAMVDQGNAVAASLPLLRDTSGRLVSLADAVKRGPVVLDFWATWCGPCRMEMPELDAVRAQYAARGVQFFGINSDASASTIAKFVQNDPVGMTMLVDNGGVAAQAFNVSGIPAVFVIDGNHLIRATNVGYDPTTRQDLSACLDKLLEERV